MSPARFLRHTILLTGVSLAAALPAQDSARVWHPVTLDFDGPTSDEQASPNPFTDYRLEVTFANGPRRYRVPGYFAADGRAHETGATGGAVWRCHFTPDTAGRWEYSVSFRAGPGVATDLDTAAGRPLAPDGRRGTLNVAPYRGPATEDFRTRGRLGYVGEHYLRFGGDGSYFVKGGTDSPENLLAFADFDNTRPRMAYAAHVGDWRPGDPTWRDTLGRGLVGAINYLAGRHVNSLYFMPLTVGGDAKDVSPFADPALDYRGSPANDNLRYDVSKLAQWAIVFAHAQSRGLHLNAVLNEGEVENKDELDGGGLGPERRLYYRELVARFAHFNALQWNLCEEYDGGGDTGWRALHPDTVKAWAAYLSAVDPYGHPVTVHNVDIDSFWTVNHYGPFLGHPDFDLTSLQAKQRHFRYGKLIEEGRRYSRAAGRPWAFSLDESKLFNTFTNRPDDQQASTQNRARREILWPAYLSGAAGHEWISAAWALQDFRRLERIWDYQWFARRFVEALPFWRMEPMDSLLADESPEFGGGQVFALPDSVYAVYLPNAAATGRLDLRGARGRYRMRWYDPRTGTFVGDTIAVAGGDWVSLGFVGGAGDKAEARRLYRADPEDDWAVLVVREGGVPSEATGSGESPTQGSGESPTQGFGEGPAPRSGEGPAPRFGESPTQRSDESPTQRFGESPTQRFGESPTQRFGESPAQGFGESPTSRERTRDTDAWPAFVLPWDDTTRAVTDLNHYLHRPAGKYGFVGVDAGQLRFAEGGRWRIWGTNITLGAALPPAADAPLIARRMAKFGINSVRFHHVDHRWPDGIIARHSTGTRAPLGRDMGVPWDGRGEPTQALDPEAMARLDWFVYQLAEQGIYTNLNVTVSRAFTAADGVAAADSIGYAKAITYFDPRIIALQKDYLRRLLTHVNPWTGRRYADEPAVAIVELLNENSLVDAWEGGKLFGLPEYPANWSKVPHAYQAQLDSLWAEYRRRHGVGAPAARLRPDQFAGVDTARLRAERRFYAGIEEAYAREMLRFVREDLGARQLVTVTAAHGGPAAEFDATLAAQHRAGVPLAHGHAYWEGYWNTPNLRRHERPAREWFREWRLSPNTAAVDHPARSPAALLARYRVAGKPYFVGEVNHHFPNDFAAETFAFNTAYALLQDWDGIYWFGYAGSDWEGVFDFPTDVPRGQEVLQTQAVTRFEWYANDPVKMTQALAAGLLWHRGDVAPARELVTRDMHEALPPTTALRHRTALRLGAREARLSPKPAGADTNDIGLSPKRADVTASDVRLSPKPASATAGATGLSPKPASPTVGDTGLSLKQAALATRDPGSQTRDSAIVSDHDQLRITVDTASGNAFTYRTAASAGFVAHRGTHRRDGLTLELATDFAAVHVLALGGQVLAEADTLLVVAGARVANTGMTWRPGPYPAVEDWGRAPTRIEPVLGTLTLAGPTFGELTPGGRAGRRATVVPLDGRGHAIATEATALVAGPELPVPLPGRWGVPWVMVVWE